MQVASNTVVSLDLRLSDLWGNVLQGAGEPLRYLHGGYDNILPAVETALEGKRPGDRVEVRVDPEEGFGEYDETMLRVEPRAAFPEGIEIGMQFEGVPGDTVSDLEGEPAVIYTVTDLADDKVVLDGNHPFAGMALKFECHVLEVRAATQEELEQGYPEDLDAVPLKVL